MKGVQVSSNEGPCPFPSGDVPRLVEIGQVVMEKIFKRLNVKVCSLLFYYLPLEKGMVVH